MARAAAATGRLPGMLIGAVLSSTDAASVFSILRSKQLNLKDNTASMLEMESGSNDPCSYMLTVIILAVMKGGFTGGSLVRLVVLQLVFGVVVGVIVAAFGAWVLSQMKNTSDGVDTIFVFSMALLAYAGAAVLGGNGYLSTYLAGLILGNRPLHNKKSLVHFFDGLTGLMQMLIFFLLGLLAFPSALPGIIPVAFAIALFLTFVARPVSVFAILTPFRCSVRQQLLVAWSVQDPARGIRGLAQAVRRAARLCPLLPGCLLCLHAGKRELAGGLCTVHGPEDRQPDEELDRVAPRVPDAGWPCTGRVPRGARGRDRLLEIFAV